MQDRVTVTVAAKRSSVACLGFVASAFFGTSISRDLKSQAAVHAGQRRQRKEVEKGSRLVVLVDQKLVESSPSLLDTRK